eukprot:CAMPEP_0185738400 /NCGR_PEP_ID=MMETSP1171-20130828/32799_1 /TAXON_ID=374046 /ORGANISM="Helicotheca tamensis, Strain CCMP826" /LENGTH=110 /DNA_ID=CAMNT_0028409619 /DNA_START=69 /DNA_END=397 /DNA_ORIENTATION=-
MITPAVPHAGTVQSQIINTSVTVLPTGVPATPSVATVAANSGMLVPSVRAMMDAEHTERTLNQRSDSVELKNLTAGSIADLCNVTRELKRKAEEAGNEVNEADEVKPYTP